MNDGTGRALGDTLVLGIETSCDETAAAIVARGRDGTGRILSNVVRSQWEQHRAFGGVVPEIAARAHVECLDDLIREAVAVAGISLADVDAVAATAGPGLIGGLIVGLVTGKALAFALRKPLLAVNHLEAHALTVGLTDAIRPPYLLLLVSGGHTQLLAVDAVGRYRRLGSTIDDALGEAFDKTAKLLGLPMPGGPAVERAALAGDPARFAFPRPLVGRAEAHFSFAGLKTAVRRQALALAPLTDRDVADLCASFQAAVAASVVDRTRRGMELFESDLAPRSEHDVSLVGAADSRGALKDAPRSEQDASLLGAADSRGASKDAPRSERRLVVAGGVAANQVLRGALTELAARRGYSFHAPPLNLCGDNAAMIAWAGAERLALGMVDGLDAEARPRWPLDADATPALGGDGRKPVKA